VITLKKSNRGVSGRRIGLVTLGSVLSLAVLPVVGGLATSGAATPAATAHDLTASPTTVAFPATPVGGISGPINVTFTNTGTTADAITDVSFGGTGANDYIGFGEDPCTSLAAGASCIVQFYFTPGALGARPATASPVDSSATQLTITLSGTGTEGYYETTSTGAVFGHGDSAPLGGTSGTHLAQPIVASATTVDDQGYWLAAADGGIFTFGDAGYFGSTGNIHLNKPIVGMASTLDDGGYWEVASDGGIFTFGDAAYFGSTGNIHLNQPIVGMAATPDDGGYWLVAADGGIFTFGDAAYFGSTGNIHLNKPIVGMAATPDGGGYWLVASDGGIFTFGDAPYLGSTGNIHLNKPIVSMAAAPDGGGYWLMASDGGVFTFGDAMFEGSSAGASSANFVALANDGSYTLQSISDTPALRHAAATAAFVARARHH
jgi:hypothetical protein